MRLLRLALLCASCMLVVPAFAQPDADCRAPAAASGYFPDKAAGKPAVIVFVHGVLGDPVGTWLYSRWLRADTFWPCLVAQQPVFAQANIYLAKYTTKPFKAPSIQEAANWLWNDLEANGVLKEHAHVAFVVHSLGGLEVTRMIMTHSQAPEVRKIRFVRFYGTPAKGSDWAAAAKTISDNPQFEEMSNPQLLDGWLTDWLARSPALGISSFCAVESDGAISIFKSSLIVTADSASALCGGVHDTLYANHMEMVKPPSAQDDPHKLLANSYSRCVRPRLLATTFSGNAPGATEAARWVGGMRDTLVETANAQGDVAAAAQPLLYTPEGFGTSKRYVLPRAGSASLASTDNDFVDSNSFALEFRDQTISRLRVAEVETVVPLSRLGEVIGSSDAYDYAQRAQLNGGASPGDFVVITRQARVESPDRMLFLVAATPAPAGSAARLRGFAFVRQVAACAAPAT